MDLVEQIMARLVAIREERLALMQGSISSDDPEMIGKIIADAINALENLYIVINLPPDGFVPNTPPKD